MSLRRDAQEAVKRWPHSFTLGLQDMMTARLRAAEAFRARFPGIWRTARGRLNFDHVVDAVDEAVTDGGSEHENF